jgi:chromate transporter
MADKYEWLSREKVGNFLAIAQSSPGGIGVNMSAQTGFAYAGIPGAFLAALGLIAPAILTITIVARVLNAFKENKIVGAVFSGLRPAAAGLLAAAGFAAWKLTLWNGEASAWYELLRWKEGVLFAALFFCIYKFKGHPVIYIAIAAAIGVALGL